MLDRLKRRKEFIYVSKINILQRKLNHGNFNIRINFVLRHFWYMYTKMNPSVNWYQPLESRPQNHLVVISSFSHCLVFQPLPLSFAFSSLSQSCKRKLYKKQMEINIETKCNLCKKMILFVFKTSKKKNKK